MNESYLQLCCVTINMYYVTFYCIITLTHTVLGLGDMNSQ